MSVLTFAEVLKRNILSGHVLEKVSEINGRKIPSYGPDTGCYDVRAAQEWHTVDAEGKIIDPMVFDFAAFTEVSHEPRYYLRPHTTVLIPAVEKFVMPSNVIAMLTTKSCHARASAHVVTSKINAGWPADGKPATLVIEISNPTRNTVMLEAGTGVASVVFFELTGDEQYDGMFGGQRSMTYANGVKYNLVIPEQLR